MEKGTGIGGLYFRARDPAPLGRWYHERLGVTPTPTSYDEHPWRPGAGPTVFAPFPADTTCFGDPTHAWMVNFRVRDLDAMVAQLRAAGAAVEVDPEEYPNGWFARLTGPGGQPRPAAGATGSCCARRVGMRTAPRPG